MTQNVSPVAASASEFSHWHDLLDPEAAEAPYHGVAPSGELIGPYRVLRSLGQGGMGEVFLAERADEHFEQRVAIKLVRRELLSKQVQSRLRVERQILASLEHPNIARLLDGGSTKDGIPYIVMEYVDGEPIDVYCDQYRLTLQQRLEIFRSVCDAVHSAHQNLIVHRDLKPSNILVTASGTPKLLDFGIAKMLDARQFTQTVALTEADYRMLTPDHASPEQLTGDLITTASDTYVLGVLLYELLTGCKPFAVKGRSFAELERVICEEPPLPPSHVFMSASAESARHAEDIATGRSSTVARLKRELQGDLSSILLMALRKEPERRYGSVRQLSEDIGRYLKGQPVNARIDSWTYRTAKFVKRHKVVVGLAAVLAATLVGSTVFMYVNSMELKRQRDVADKQSATATAIAKFLTDLFNAPNPEEARGNDPTVLEFLEKAPQRIRTELAGQQEVQASLLNTIGVVYMQLSEHEKAEPLLLESWNIFRNELRIETTVTSEIALNLGELHLRDDLGKSQQFYTLSIEISERLEGPNGIGTARGECGLGYVQMRRNDLSMAERHLRECLGIYQTIPMVESSEVAIASDNLARVLGLRGKLAEAESIHREWLNANQSLPPASPRLIEQQQSLAVVLQRRGKLQEAVQLHRTVLEQTRKVWADSSRLFDALVNYGWALQELEQFVAADAAFEEAAAINAKLTSTTDLDRAYLLGRMAGLALDRGMPQRAETLYRDALRMLSKLETTRFRASVLSGLSKTLLSTDRADEAEQYIRQAMPLLEQSPGKIGYLYGLGQAILGRALWQRGNPEEAAPLLHEGYDTYVKQRGPDVPEARLLHGWLEQVRTTKAH